MRFHYYRFPEGTDDETKVRHGCAVVMKNGDTSYPSTMVGAPYDRIAYVEDTINVSTVRYAKQLLKEFGGIAWTDHCERDGGVFETTEIKLTGNNSRFRYNRHL